MVEEISQGWDSRAFLVNGVWLEREPLRPEVGPRLVTEVRLLPWLAPQLPLRIPIPEVVQDEPLRVRHRLIEGKPVHTLTTVQGSALGHFFHTLHSVDAQAAAARGAPDTEAALADHLGNIDRFRGEVLPRVPLHLRRRAESLLERVAEASATHALVHGDVGPAHILLCDGQLTGVIDWSDAHVGDPALDLAWLLCGSNQGDAVAEAYGADRALCKRARDWHLLGPWHEVMYGLDSRQPTFVDSGMAGVLARLELR